MSNQRRTILLSVLLAACGGSPPAPPAATPTAASWPEACPPIDGVEPLIATGRTLMIGEVHGTEEIPRFVGDVACHASARGPVTVALEIPRDEQARIDGFLASAGAPADVAALLTGAFWTRATQDGRSSRAMLGLLARVRAARAAHVDVVVLAFDLPDGRVTKARDQEMAAAIQAARRAAPARTFVALSGNYHSRRTTGAPWDDKAEWMTWYLAGAGIELTTLDVEQAGGGMWVCMMDDAGAQTCGAHESKPSAVGASWRVRLAPDVEGHDGRYTVGPTHASPPAITGS